MPFKGRKVLITGGSRGIGKAIAIRLAAEGAEIAIVGKTAEPNPKLEGTIYTAAEEITKAGAAKVVPIQGDIRFEDSIDQIVKTTVEQLGGIDILINNASAINLSPTEQMEPKRWDLMHDINVRGTFFMSKACIPALKKSTNAHILNLSPPLTLNPEWFGRFLAYSISKFGMSMCVLGLAEELKQHRIGVNALWPKTTIATAAIQNIVGGDIMVQRSRKPEIVADAAYYILQRPGAETTGNFFIDEDILIQQGITDFTHYAVNPAQKLMLDLFL